MRFRSLELAPFGHFARRTIDLSGGARGLHLLVGANEAGKSTILKAIDGFLFRMPARGGTAFALNDQTPAVTATVEDEAGRCFTWTRRRGNQAILRDTADKSLPDDPLVTLLGGLDRDGYRRQYGLDHERLRAGGESLTAAGGDLGKTLLAAAGNLPRIQSLRATMETRRSSLFLPNRQAAVPRINQLLKQHAEVETQLNQATLDGGRWRRLQEQVATARAEEQTARNHVQQLHRERTAIDRRRAGLRHRLDRDAAIAQLADLQDVPDLPTDFAERCTEVVTAVQVAESRRAKAIERRNRSVANRDRVTVPEAVLQAAKGIRLVVSGLSAERKAVEDRRVLQGQERDGRDKIAHTIRQLHYTYPTEDTADPVTPAQRQTLTRLVRAKSSVVTDVEVATRERDSLMREREALLRTKSQMPSVERMATLDQALQTAAQDADLDGRLRDATVKLQAAERSLAGALRGLGTVRLTPQAAASLTLPLAETVARHEARLRTLAEEERALAQRLHEIARRQQARQKERDRLIDGRDLPTETDLAAARTDRDETLARFFAQGGAHEADGGLFQNAWVRPDQVRSSIARVDDLTDRMLAQGKIVAERAALDRDLADLAEERAALEAEQAAHQAHQADADAAWQREIEALPLGNLTPAELRDFRTQHDVVLARLEDRAGWEQHRNDLLRRRAQVARILIAAQQADASQPTDREPARESSDEGDSDDQLRIGPLIEAVRGELRRLDADRGRAETAAQRLADLEQRIGEAEAARTEATAWHERWTRAWRAATSELGLPDDANPDWVGEDLDLLADLGGERQHVLDLTRRIGAIRKGSERYAAHLNEARLAVGEPPLASDVPSHERWNAVEDLGRRLDDAIRLQDRYRAAEAQAEADEAEFREATVEVESLHRRRDELCGLARSTPDQLGRVIDRHRRRIQATAEIERCDRELRHLADSEDVAGFIASLAEVEDVTLEAEQVQLDRDIAVAEAALTGATERRVHAEQELRRWSGDGDAAPAAIAATEREAIRARLIQATEDYLTLTAAINLLDRAMIKYRDDHEHALLRRGGELLAALTEGRFTALRAEFDEGPDPVLVAVAPGSPGRTEFRVAEMSEGTKDQLYLALRLATLVTSLDEGRPPLPLILDDVLVHFDDQRSAATLRVLADLSDRTQVILLTHHPHLVELARQAVDPSRLFIQTIERPEAVLL